MITNNELEIANESYVHKDFYQIYPEILDLVKKITERWDPASSNESDPGVVILKLLGFLSDKINYNVDKNVLECFMPSATQEDSMRKLCSMMGYEMHYYVSATTNVSFMWDGNEPKGFPQSADDMNNSRIVIPRFSVISNSVSDKASKVVSYVLTEEVNLLYRGYVDTVKAIEGEKVDFAINEDNIVRISNIDDNNRLYFPETQIAENGIWIEPASSENQIVWERTTNLNTTVSTSTKAYWKFCFDSTRKLPYILFPDNIADLIGEGVRIYYIRTSGVNGNIPVDTLNSLASSQTVVFENQNGESENVPVSKDSDTYLVIKNTTVGLGGQDVETLDDAYNGFKKTIGTFDTLITCRDYANAIYNMVTSSVDANPFVSNIQVSDIRDDINFTVKTVTFDDYGVVYKDVVTDSDSMDHFTLYLYPLNPVTTLYKAANYENTFKPNGTCYYDIMSGLSDFKTISHNIKLIQLKDKYIYLIKNYYHLSARLATTYKVNKYEGAQILGNVTAALYSNFNARKLDYGTEIPYDSILSVIQNADPRIKFVSLDEPELETRLMTARGLEKGLYTTGEGGGKDTYYGLVAKNVLAGRLPLLNYDTRFDYSFGQTNHGSNGSIYGVRRSYPDNQSFTMDTNYSITAIETDLSIPTSLFETTTGYTLKKNESIQFKARNLRSILTYSLSINYHYRGTDIPKDTEYKFTQNDRLYINYTDSNDEQHNIVYFVDTNDKPKYKDSALHNVEKDWTGIVKTTFDLTDSVDLNNIPSRDGGKTWQKTDGFDFPGSNITGMYTITGQEAIDIRGPVKSTLKDNPSYCYWVTTNSNKIRFKRRNTGSGDGPWFDYTLNTNEYFFYTDSLKNSLITKGSGTTLSLHVDGSEADYIEWELPLDSNMDSDDVLSRGIGAFADTDWVVQRFKEDEYYLEMIENQFITLGEGDVISVDSAIDLQSIGSEWAELEDYEKITYSGGKKLPVFTESSPWEVRAILNLNIGPNLSFPLESDPEVVRKVILHTSLWLDPNGDPITVTDTTDLSKFTEEIVTEDIADYSRSIVLQNNTLETYYLRSNYLVQQSGSSMISARRYSYSGVIEDDLSIYKFLDVGCTTQAYGSGSGDPDGELTLRDTYTSISFKDVSAVKLPVFLPENTFGVFMVYCAMKEESGSGAPTVTVAATDADNTVKCLSLYKDGKNGLSEELPSLTLNKGMNVVKVTEGCTLTLTSNSNEVVITLSDINVVKRNKLTDDYNDDKWGVNIKLLGLDLIDPNNLSNNIEEFMTKLKSLDPNEMFYYNVPVNNMNQLDVTSMDSYSWFNYNNICNKFVMAQLDTDLSDIVIAKSSRTDQW